MLLQFLVGNTVLVHYMTQCTVTVEPLHYHVSGLLVCRRPCVLHFGGGAATLRSPGSAVTLLCKIYTKNIRMNE